MVSRKLQHLWRYGRITKWSTFQQSCLFSPKESLCRGNSDIRQFGPNPSDVFDRQGAYEGHGKTTVNMLNKETVGVNMVDSFAVDGFRLNSDTKVLGPCIVFPNHVLSWRVRGYQDITEDSLTLFKMLDPQVELLIVGYGEHLPKSPVSAELILKMKRLGINMEVFPTENAIPVYNFLVEEGRIVAAALIPPGHIKLIESDVIQTKQRYNTLYGDIDKNFLGQDKKSGRASLDPYEKISLIKENDIPPDRKK